MLKQCGRLCNILPDAIGMSKGDVDERACCAILQLWCCNVINLGCLRLVYLKSGIANFMREETDSNTNKIPNNNRKDFIDPISPPMMPYSRGGNQGGHLNREPSLIPLQSNMGTEDFV